MIQRDHANLASIDGRRNLDKRCDVFIAAWDHYLKVLRLFSGKKQRGHCLSNTTGTDRGAGQ